MSHLNTHTPQACRQVPAWLGGEVVHCYVVNAQGCEALVSEAILEHGGILSVVGDGCIVAYWNSSPGNHANITHSLLAALEIRKVNAKLAEKDRVSAVLSSESTGFLAKTEFQLAERVKISRSLVLSAMIAARCRKEGIDLTMTEAFQRKLCHPIESRKIGTATTAGGPETPVYRLMDEVCFEIREAPEPTARADGLIKDAGHFIRSERSQQTREIEVNGAYFLKPSSNEHGTAEYRLSAAS